MIIFYEYKEINKKGCLRFKDFNKNICICIVVKILFDVDNWLWVIIIIFLDLKYVKNVYGLMWKFNEFL